MLFFVVGLVTCFFVWFLFSVTSQAMFFFFVVVVVDEKNREAGERTTVPCLQLL